MSPSILVVEDYADLRSAIADALTRENYECDRVSSRDAIAKLRERQYETILIDPVLPIKEDPVMHFILEEQPDQAAKVVVMTDPDREDEMMPNRCLVKPFNIAQLFAKIRD